MTNRQRKRLEKASARYEEARQALAVASFNAGTDDWIRLGFDTVPPVTLGRVGTDFVCLRDVLPHHAK